MLCSYGQLIIPDVPGAYPSPRAPEDPRVSPLAGHHEDHPGCPHEGHLGGLDQGHFGCPDWGHFGDLGEDYSGDHLEDLGDPLGGHDEVWPPPAPDQSPKD